MPELTRRYVVMAMAAAAPFDPADRDAPFVLKPWKDPAALIALKSYRDHCYPELSRDLDEWIRLIEGGPATRGGVGRQNEAHLETARSASRSGTTKAKQPRRKRPTRPRPKAKVARAVGRRAAKPKRRSR